MWALAAGVRASYLGVRASYLGVRTTCHGSRTLLSYGCCDAPLALQEASARRRCTRFHWHSRPQYEVLVPTRLPCLRFREGDRAASLQDAARSVCYFGCSLLLSRILVKSLTASSPWPGARCAYRIVMASDAWPSRLLTTMSGVPDWTSQLANVCLSE